MNPAKRNFKILSAISFLRGLHTSAFSTIWQPFALSLGISVAGLGLLGTISGLGNFAGTSGIITMIMQPIGGWLADRTGRKQIIVAGSILTITAYVMFAMTDVLRSLMLLSLGTVLLGLTALSRPARRSATAEAAGEQMLGSAFSLITLITILPGIAMPTVSAWVVHQFGYATCLLALMATELLAIYLMLCYFIENRKERNLHWSELRDLAARTLHLPEKERGILLAIAGDAITWGITWSLLYGMVIKAYGYNAFDVGLMASAMALSWIVTQLPIGKLIDLFGPKTVMLLAQLIGIPILMIWLTQAGLIWMLLSMLLLGMNAAAWLPAVDTYMSQLTQRDERGEVFGRLNALRDLAGFPAPLLGGLLFELGGLFMPVIASLVLLVVLVLIIAFILKKVELGPNYSIEKEYTDVLL